MITTNTSILNKIEDLTEEYKKWASARLKEKIGDNCSTSKEITLKSNYIYNNPTPFLLYFFHLILRSGNKNGGWKPLHSVLLNNFSKRLYSAREFLLENNYVEKDTFYIIGRKCHHYKIIDNTLIDNELVNCIIEDKYFLGRYNKFQDQKKNMEFEFVDKYSESIENIQIDDVNAKKEVKLKFENGSINKEKYDNYIDSIERLKNNNKYWIIDNFSGRFHTNLTNLKSELRNYLYFKDNRRESMYSIDIKNSQLLCLSILLDGIDLNSKLASIPEIKFILNRIKYFEKPIDFIKECKNGNIYDLLAEKSKLSRSVVKESFFKYIFSKPTDKVWNVDKDLLKFNRTFKETYPKAKEIIDNIRYSTPEAFLAKVLQIAEVQLILNEALGKCYEKGVKNILTIHDSYLVNKKDIINVHDSLIEVYKSYNVGDVKIDIKNLTLKKNKATKKKSTVAKPHNKIKTKNNLYDMSYIKYGVIVEKQQSSYGR